MRIASFPSGARSHKCPRSLMCIYKIMSVLVATLVEAGAIRSSSCGFPQMALKWAKWASNKRLKGGRFKFHASHRAKCAPMSAEGERVGLQPGGQAGRRQTTNSKQLIWIMQCNACVRPPFARSLTRSSSRQASDRDSPRRPIGAHQASEEQKPGASPRRRRRRRRRLGLVCAPHAACETCLGNCLDGQHTQVRPTAPFTCCGRSARARALPICKSSSEKAISAAPQ